MDLSITNPSRVSTDNVHTELSHMKDPKNGLADVRKNFDGMCKLLKGTKKDRRVLRSIIRDSINKLTQELNEVEQELEKYVLFEKLTHHEPALERHISELYQLGGNSDKFREFQIVVGLRNAMKLFQENYDAYVQHISYLEIAKEYLEDSIDEAVLVGKCLVKGEDPDVLLRKYRSASEASGDDQ